MVNDVGLPNLGDPYPGDTTIVTVTCLDLDGVPVTLFGKPMVYSENVPNESVVFGSISDILEAEFRKRYQKMLDEEGRRLEQLLLFGDPRVPRPLGVFYANDPEPDAIVEG